MEASAVDAKEIDPLWLQFMAGYEERHFNDRPSMLQIKREGLMCPSIDMYTLEAYSKLVMRHSTSSHAIVGGEPATNAMLELCKHYEDMKTAVRSTSPYDHVQTVVHCSQQMKLENGGSHASTQIAVLTDVVMTAVVCTLWSCEVPEGA